MKRARGRPREWAGNGMKNFEFRISNSSFFIRTSKFFILLFLAAPLAANDLSVDRRTVRVGETVAITVSLEDAFATVEDIDVPVRNLTISSTPSVSSEFSWINGTTVRRKVFRWSARATAPGPAVVGPLVIALPDGRRESFPPVVLQVLPDRAAGSNDPATVLRELLGDRTRPFLRRGRGGQERGVRGRAGRGHLVAVQRRQRAGVADRRGAEARGVLGRRDRRSQRAAGRRL